MTQEILMEIEKLYFKMNDTNIEIEYENGNDRLPFAKVLFTITSNMTRENLFNMTDEKLLKIIQKKQLIEE